MSLRILMLTSEYPPRIGGVASHVAELAQALHDLGNEITVIAPASEGWLPAASSIGPRVLRYSPWLRAQPVSDWLLARWCRRWISRHAIDVIHVHGLRPLRAALTLGHPVVFTNHTSGFLNTVAAGGRRLEALGRRIARAAYLIAPSEELVVAARTAGYSGPCDYIPNGVDAQRFTPGTARALRARWGLNDSHVAVVIARRLVEKNGVMSAALAAPLLAPKVRLVFVGDGPLRAALEAELRRNGARERAHFTGAVANRDMPEVYRAADICLLPSLIEATSIAGLEAMACGVPLVGTRVGGIPALISDDSGVLVPPKDPAAIAAALNGLAHDTARRQALGVAARRRIEANFTWREIARQTLAVYRATLAAPCPPPHSNTHG